MSFGVGDSRAARFARPGSPSSRRDRRAQPRMRREHPMKPRQVHPRRRHGGCEARDEVRPMKPTLDDWYEIARPVRRAPHAVDEGDALLTMFDKGRLSLAALKCSVALRKPSTSRIAERMGLRAAKE